MGKAHNAIYWFDLKLAQVKGLVFWRTFSNSIFLNDSVPADCLVKVVTRNQHDTEEEILY